MNMQDAIKFCKENVVFVEMIVFMGILTITPATIRPILAAIGFTILIIINMYYLSIKKMESIKNILYGWLS